MKTEFNLSEKMHIHWGTEPAYAEEDVREFIKRLKENIKTDYDDVNECIIEEIDKLAGDKLI